jgi:hypothetical protein
VDEPAKSYKTFTQINNDKKFGNEEIDSSRKDPHSWPSYRKFLPSGVGRKKKLFRIIVSVSRLTFTNFLRGSILDVFWNDPI